MISTLRAVRAARAGLLVRIPARLAAADEGCNCPQPAAPDPAWNGTPSAGLSIVGGNKGASSHNAPALEKQDDFVVAALVYEIG